MDGAQINRELNDINEKLRHQHELWHDVSAGVQHNHQLIHGLQDSLVKVIGALEDVSAVQQVIHLLSISTRALKAAVDANQP